MSGTSMDAIDVALVKFDKQSAASLDYQQFAIPGEIQQKIRAIDIVSTISVVTELDVILGNLFAEAVQKVLDSNNVKIQDIAAIGSHGQTVLHLPNNPHPRTLQIGDANIIANLTGITTVSDFRRMDIAAGGQGAPLACAFHAWHFRKSKCNRVILNIGGMANITILPGDERKEVSGFDTGPGNALMDDWIQNTLGKDCDKNGEWAASGHCHADLLALFLEHDYFKNAPPKSTGKDEFNLNYLKNHLSRITDKLKPRDVQATLLELSARTISNAIKEHAKDTHEIMVCGGGIHNPVLMQAFRDALPEISIVSTANQGVDPDAMEAIVFAWLAKKRLERQPGNLPSVTGAKGPVILGAVYKPS